MKTFEEIAPLWAAKLKEDFTNIRRRCVRDGKELDMDDYGCCIVGEAYSFNDSYRRLFGLHSCMSCRSLAKEFGDISESSELTFTYTKERFVKHWNEKHK